MTVGHITCYKSGGNGGVEGAGGAEGTGGDDFIPIAYSKIAYSKIALILNSSPLAFGRQ